MKMLRGIATTALAAVLSIAQASPSAERGSLRLHYIQKPIGIERYEIARDGGALVLSADFDFTDRGGRVQLAATLRTRPDFTPISFRSKGKSYRFVNVDADVQAVPQGLFTIDGYAPFAAQMLLVRYWLRHGRPGVLKTVPGQPPHDVVVEARGREPLRVGGRTVQLDRYAIDGVVWGREALWLDEAGSLAAAVTRAGGLSFEAVREDLEPALVEFVERATRDRIADLVAITRRTPPVQSGAYALVGGTIVDGAGSPPIADAVIVVRDGRIADVGSRASVPVPAGMARVEIAGKTVVPGLWDMHTHVTQIEWAPVYLAAGVTTVRDMGNEFEFITALRDALASRRAFGAAAAACRPRGRRRTERVRRHLGHDTRRGA